MVTQLRAALAAALILLPGAAAAEAVLSYRMEETVEAPVDEVWKAIATAEGLSTWMAPAANVELRLGGAYELLFMPQAEPGKRGMEGTKVLSFIPGRMISYTGTAPPNFPTVRAQGGPWGVYELEPDGTARTRVVFHGMVPDRGEEWRAAFEAAQKA